MDATIIAAPSSTKNRSGERDPEMHQTKKGNQWHFGMKALIAVDADSGLVHTGTITAANKADVEQITDLLHVKEEQVWTDFAHAVTLFALSNLWMARHQLIKRWAWCARK
ncbi:transposase, IS4 family protein [Acidovorax sp. KKS102]|nr:transposase, IS4 family protein [Acidovorax sp. KKS102]